MSSQLVLVWLGSVALISTFGGLVASVPQYRNGDGSLTGLIAYAFGLMFWMLYTVTALNYVIVSNGETITQSGEPLALAGAIGAITCLVLLFDGAMRTLGITR